MMHLQHDLDNAIAIEFMDDLLVNIRRISLIADVLSKDNSMAISIRAELKKELSFLEQKNKDYIDRFKKRVENRR